MSLEPPSRWNRCPLLLALRKLRHVPLPWPPTPRCNVCAHRPRTSRCCGRLRCVEQSAEASSTRRGRRCSLFTRETCTRAHPELVRADLEHDGARALVRVLFISTAYLHLQQSLLLVWARLTLCRQRRRAAAASEQSRGIDRRIGGADRRSLLLRAHRCGTHSLSLGTPTRHCHHRDATATGLGLHGHFPIQAIAQSKSSS